MSERELTMSAALNEAMHEEMERDATVLTIGEDIAEMGGLFQVTEGLLERFGSLKRAHTWGTFAHHLGVMVMIGAIAWGARWLWKLAPRRRA